MDKDFFHKPKGPTISVLLADDHCLVRDGIRLVLKNVPDIRIMAEASTREEILEAVRISDFDLVLLDIIFPEANGIDILKDIRRIKPGLAVLFFSMHAESQVGARAMANGANGYVTKGTSEGELIQAIRTAGRGEKYIIPALGECLAEIAGEPLNKRKRLLSKRETQIIKMMATGLTTGQIASKLKLATGTISTYRTRIMEKLNLKTNADIVYHAVRGMNYL